MFKQTIDKGYILSSTEADTDSDSSFETGFYIKQAVKPKEDSFKIKFENVAETFD